ncbi:TPA: hypothetical protein NR789_001876 [Enterococcus faecalis]|uniref:hypothetical protein n=1 Tax=Enterococcus faecalis TaxID=1351 RepID=UPI00132F85EB|nr:hypothetical protein [Enterococcus faecalis]HCJ0858971.1 hypothetical protein [Enterococcus faecalis]HCJ4774397.1 hypothetical protein [Enterococcus faecalis]
MKLIEFMIANKDNVVFCLAVLSLIIPIFIKYKRKLTIILAIISCIYIYNSYANFDSKTEKIAENTTEIVDKTKDKMSEKANTIIDKASEVLDKNTQNFEKQKEEKKKQSKILNENQKDSLKATTESTTETTDIDFENELSDYYNNLDNFKTYQNQSEIKTDADERANTALADLENEK